MNFVFDTCTWVVASTSWAFDTHHWPPCNYKSDRAQRHAVSCMYNVKGAPRTFTRNFHHDRRMSYILLDLTQHVDIWSGLDIWDQYDARPWSYPLEPWWQEVSWIFFYETCEHYCTCSSTDTMHARIAVVGLTNSRGFAKWSHYRIAYSSVWIYSFHINISR